MNRPSRSEYRAFGGGLMTLSVILWITYATARSNNGRHYLPHWALFLALGGLLAGIVIVVGSIVWPTPRAGPRPPTT